MCVYIYICYNTYYWCFVLTICSYLEYVYYIHSSSGPHILLFEWWSFFVVVQLLSCVGLFGPSMNCSPPGSFVRGISQTRTLEGVAISFSRGFCWPRDGSLFPAFAGGFFTTEPPGKPCGHYCLLCSDFLKKNTLYFECIYFIWDFEELCFLNTQHSPWMNNSLKSMLYFTVFSCFITWSLLQYLWNMGFLTFDYLPSCLLHFFLLMEP